MLKHEKGCGKKAANRTEGSTCRFCGKMFPLMWRCKRHEESHHAISEMLQVELLRSSSSRYFDSLVCRVHSGNSIGMYKIMYKSLRIHKT